MTTHVGAREIALLRASDAVIHPSRQLRGLRARSGIYFGAFSQEGGWKRAWRECRYERRSPPTCAAHLYIYTIATRALNLSGSARVANMQDNAAPVVCFSCCARWEILENGAVAWHGRRSVTVGEDECEETAHTARQNTGSIALSTDDSCEPLCLAR